MRWTFTLLTAVLTTAATWAEERPPLPTVQGILTAVDQAHGRVVVQTPGGATLTLEVHPWYTSVQIGDEAFRDFCDLRPGWSVEAIYDTEGGKHWGVLLVGAPGGTS